jgi:predicted MFS family arabinose efflux permease
VFAAQFSLSHAGWLIAYPLAGWLGAFAGMQITLLVLAGLAVVALVPAIKLWPANDPTELLHRHDDLAEDHSSSAVRNH